ncbi:unnamed protein product [Lymnaea stagnalis]|uniref:Apolipoprotein D n=1 Tax=Lymnaea stagnalis TaxID=6523 RepID=A0AAV2IBA8_LYMST
MMTMTTSIFVLATLAASANAFLVMSLGKCPDIPIKEDLDLNQYLGKWYSYENFDAPFQFGLSCITANYSIRPDGNIKVLNGGVKKLKIFGRTVMRTPTNIEGEARIVNSDRPAGLAVKFPGQPDMGDNNKANYNIISTDYRTYSLVYSCSQPTLLPVKVEFVWILTRERGVRPDNINALKTNLRVYGVKTENFKPVDNTEC